MNIIVGYPPNYKLLKQKFQVKDSTVFTYGNTLYTNERGGITKNLLVHEETHVKQQGEYPDKWWNLYVKDSRFRLNEELEAYKNQYADWKRTHLNEISQHNFLHEIASDLSSNMYGGIVTYEGAWKMIGGTNAPKFVLNREMRRRLKKQEIL